MTARLMRDYCLEASQWTGGECLLIPGVKKRPTAHYNGTRQYASRVVWQMAHPDQPIEQFILHTCDNDRCININHLYEGSLSQNALDRAQRNPGTFWRLDDICRNGHPRTTETTRFWKSGNRIVRRCVLCHRAADYKSKANRSNRNRLK